MQREQAEEARRAFMGRLILSLERHGVYVGGTAVAMAYNLRNPSAPVTSHAVRKWLTGASIPTHDKIIRIAEWLGVSASWLQFGTIGGEASATDLPPNANAALVSDLEILTVDECAVVRALVDALLKIRVRSGS